MNPINFALLHGGGQGSWVWEETLNVLRMQAGDALNALALDVPGCGLKRDRITADISFDEIVSELLTDIESSGLTDIVLVGHSQAGSVIPALITRRPELFRRAIYVTCSIPLPGQTIMEMIGKGVHGSNPNEVGWPLDPATTSHIERVTAMMCNDMDETSTAAFLAKIGPDQWPASSYRETRWQFTRPATVPASYVLCLRDNILPTAWQQRFARERFDCEQIVTIDAGHQVMNTQPEALATILLREAG